MTTVILRIALDGGDKWAPGTILGAYPPDMTLGAAELAGFHCLKVSSAKYSLEDFQAMRCKRVVAIDELIDAELLSAKIEQRNNLLVACQVEDGPAENLEKQGFILPQSVKRQGAAILMSEMAIKPDLDTTIVFDSLTLNDPPEQFKEKLIEVVSDVSLENLERR